MKAHDDRAMAFRRLHVSGCFVMPNPWDVGSARALESMGFKALATTSAGFAWTLGRADNQVTLDQVLVVLRKENRLINVVPGERLDRGPGLPETHGDELGLFSVYAPQQPGPAVAGRVRRPSRRRPR